MGEYFVYSSYRSVETTVANAASDQLVDMSTGIKRAEKVLIRTDQTITVKFNDTANDSVTISVTEGSLTIENLVVSKIYVSNSSGTTANIKVLGLGPLKSS